MIRIVQLLASSLSRGYSLNLVGRILKLARRIRGLGIVASAAARYERAVRSLTPYAWRVRRLLSLPPWSRAELRAVVRRTRAVHLVPFGAGFLTLVGALVLLTTTSPSPAAMTAALTAAKKDPLLVTLRGTPTDPLAARSSNVPLRLPDVRIPLTLQTASYVVRPGDTLSQISEQYGVSDETLISFNGIDDARLIQPGMKLLIPNLDGILYRVRAGDTLDGIAEAYKLDPTTVVEVNRLTSTVLVPNQRLFLPGAHMNYYAYRKAMGTLFIYPTHGVITSPFGMRLDPFTQTYEFHNGVDIANSIGTPVVAAMDGTVAAVSEDRGYGRYIVINNGGGYSTLYAHLSKRLAWVGEYVRTGQEIAEMGDTGYSTGPHLHFSIFKNGVPVNPLIYIGYR